MGFQKYNIKEKNKKMKKRKKKQTNKTEQNKKATRIIKNNNWRNTVLKNFKRLKKE